MGPGTRRLLAGWYWYRYQKQVRPGQDKSAVGAIRVK